MPEVLRRDPGRIIARFPNALILAAAWCFVGALLLWPDRGLPRHSHLVEGFYGNWPDAEDVYGAVFFAFGTLVFIGFIGYMSVRVRKLVYLGGGALTAGVAVALATDGSWLSAGLLGIFAGLSLDTYWRFPRRHEERTTRTAAAEHESKAA